MNKAGLRRLILKTSAIIFWLAVWEIISHALDADFIFPSVFETTKTLIDLLATTVFWKSLLHSLVRVLLGFFIGLSVGCILAPLAHRFELCRTLIAPLMSIVKSTPVASFIMVLWFFIGSAPVPVVIGGLMVAPLCYHNLLNALKEQSAELSDVCTVFNVRGYRKFRYLYFPKILDFLIPAAVSGVGLCWKASIAAEIIAYTQNSLGRQIYLSKAFLEGTELFAYTITVILMSLIFEKLMYFLGEVVKKKCHL
jgi:NitT/TauT family transport system permease protein